MSLKSVIERQKIEWQRNQARSLIKRDAFEFAQRQLPSELVKVIVGPRRAGKSAFAGMLLRGKNTAYLNFDELELKGVGFDDVLAELYAANPECEYVFFDEIQNLDNWQLALNRLQRDGKNIVVTGSNARLLSSELMTHLTGRHVAIEILPFSFREYLRAKGIDAQGSLPLPEQVASILAHFDSFMSRGGYPETVVNTSLDAGPYLSSIWNAIIYTDVVARRGVRRPQAIADIGNWVLANPGVPMSYHSIGASVGIESPITSEKYLRWLEEAYLIKHVSRYSHRALTRNRSDKRFYGIDNGLIGAVATRVTPSHGRLLENAVMSELAKKGNQVGRNLFYFKSEDGRHEVDFLVRSDDLQVTDLVQACWDISDQGTLRREVNALLSAASAVRSENVKLLIVTRSQENVINEDGKTIYVVPFWKWSTAST